MSTLTTIIDTTENPTFAEHVRQHDWDAIAHLWHTTGGMHGEFLIRTEWRQVLVDAAKEDRLDLLALIAELHGLDDTERYHRGYASPFAVDRLLNPHRQGCTCATCV